MLFSALGRVLLTLDLLFMPHEILLSLLRRQKAVYNTHGKQEFIETLAQQQPKKICLKPGKIGVCSSRISFWDMDNKFMVVCLLSVGRVRHDLTVSCSCCLVGQERARLARGSIYSEGEMAILKVDLQF